MDGFVLACVRAQVDAVLSEIARMEGSEFPYEQSQEALKVTKDVFESHKYSLASLSPLSDKSTAELACTAAFVDLSESIDLLGFILRSTSVRNAFEAYGPLLRVARQLLGDTTKLIISSEWCFSPFTYIGYHYLPGFVMIGLPAPESSNPFLLPLAGHELGHTAWAECGLARRMEKVIEDAIIEEINTRWKSECELYFHGHKQADVGTDLLARPMWKPAWDWALRQCEEHFCDFFGLRIFGEAYLHAFAYLLAPQRQGLRSMIYPNLKTRAECLAEAGRQFGLSVSSGYADLFENLEGPAPEHRRETLLLTLADSVRIKFVDELRKAADELVINSNLTLSFLTEVDECKRRMSLMVPAEATNSLMSIINAGWEGWLDPVFFRDKEHNVERLNNLREIVLKSIEVYEIETRLNKV